MALFANASRGGVSNSSHLVEFKAGRSTLEEGSTPEKRKVVSDKTKGLVYIKQSSDQLVHFIWKNRETNTIVDDLIIFPGDTEFLKVKECTDGRVFMLKFNSNSDRRLFWMQDNKADKDDELVKKVNDLLNRPPSSRASGRGGTTERSGGLAASLSALGNGSEDMGALNSLDQNQLMQLLQLMNTNGTSGSSADALISSALGGSADGATGTPATGAAAAEAGAGTGSVKLSDLQAILSQIDGKSTEGGAAVAGTSRGPQAALTDVLKSSNVSEIVKTNEQRLIPHLPNEAPIKADKNELNMTISTPQFQQAASIFGTALQTGQMGPVLQQFGCSENVRAAAATGDLLQFAKKLTEDERGEPIKEDEAKPTADVEMTSAEVDAQINREAEAEETTESAIKEPDAKRNKTTDDNMELD
ncbi:hypothetical protein QR680_012025 [Steinernema hermaphroditum]|uniref:Proteasomal ubiquitin receptor ADRM1 homolog n=1 Tax=Steinernema hermaphroditum TaxID=289476 RepID=A0AA39M011_9BILA|nr:hypothetical protein QR680_012025 [Steinernema hermaphroditum]